MTRVRAALVIAAIVVGSALAGAGINHAVARHGRRPRTWPPTPPTPEHQVKHRREMLERMTKDLDLSTAQRAGIDSILRRTDSALYVVRMEIQPRLQQIFETSRSEITARLDSTQRQKFEKLRPKRGSSQTISPPASPPARQ